MNFNASKKEESFDAEETQNISNPIRHTVRKYETISTDSGNFTIVDTVRYMNLVPHVLIWTFAQMKSDGRGGWRCLGCYVDIWSWSPIDDMS